MKSNPNSFESVEWYNEERKNLGFKSCDICGNYPGTILKPDARKYLKVWRCCQRECIKADYIPKNTKEKFYNFLDTSEWYGFTYEIIKFILIVGIVFIIFV